ncbi:SDR family NAD(P)-dependent oxidoreductase [Rhodococcus koreensis]
MSASSQTPLVRSYEDSVVVIAGGTSGIGLAAANRFVQAGVRRLVLLGRDEKKGRAACESVADEDASAQVEFIPVDAGVVTEVTRAVADIEKSFGRIDVLVSAVSPSLRPDLLHRTSIDDIESQLTQLALPPMLLTRAVLPLMQAQSGGSLVHVASDAAKVPTPGETVLGAAMAAIVSFSRATAIEAKRNGVRVNSVTPSLVANTPTTANMLSGGFSKSLFEKASQLASLGVAEPEDLAELIVFLCGPAAARLTGQAISVNGGISAL